MRELRRVAMAASVLVAMGGLSACGVVEDIRYPYAGESAETVFLDAMAAMSDLKSVRVSGTLDPKGANTINFNLMNAEDGLCGGEISFSTADFDLVSTPEDSYLKGSAASWEQAPGLTSKEAAAAAKVIGDKWVRTSSEENPLGSSFLCRLNKELLTDEEATAVSEGKVPENLTVTSKGLSEAVGEKAVPLHVVDDKSTSDVWVSLEEPHHITRMTQSEKVGSVDLVFSDFDFPARITVPDPADVLKTPRTR